MPGKVWLLYRPEPFEFDGDDDRSIHLWIRRCEVFTERSYVDDYFQRLLGKRLVWRQHELFPELYIGYDDRGFRWLLSYADINPLIPVEKN